MFLLDYLREFVANYGYFAVLILVGLESAGVPLPGETALVAAAIFAGQGTLNIYLVIGCATVAAIAGDNVGYWVGREFGFPLVYKYGRLINIDEGRLKLAQYLFLRHGGKIVFFGRFVALLRIFAALLAGVNHLPWSRFLFYNAVGGFVWANVFGIGGFMVGVAIERYARPIGMAALIGAVLGAVILSRFIAKHEARLRIEAEAAMPGPLVPPKSSLGKS